MKAKNLLAVILFIAIMLAMLPSAAFIAYAAGNGTLTVGTASAAPGEDVTVDIVMGENPGIVCLHFKVTWNSHALTLKDYDVVGGAANYAMASHNGKTDGQFIFSSVNATATRNYTETGKVVSLTFTVNSEHSGDSETLTITPAANSIYDCDMKLVLFTSTNGAIHVTKPFAKAVSVTLTPPVTGAIPEDMISGTGYSGTVSWSGTPTTFAPNTTYTATITLTPTDAANNPFDASSAVTMNGNTVTPTTNTANSIVFMYTFPETGEKENVSDNASDGTALATLSLSTDAIILTPAFNPKTTRYTASVPNSTSSVTVNATATDTSASIIGTGIKSLNVGANEITVTVTAEDGTISKMYTIIVTRAASAYTLPSNGENGNTSSISATLNIEEATFTTVGDSNIPAVPSNSILLNGKETALKLNADGSVTITESDIHGLSSPILLSLPRESRENTLTGVLKKDGQDMIIPYSVYKDGTLLMVISKTGTYGMINNKKNIIDIEGHWATNTIAFITSRELFSGVGDNKFNPNEGMTRAMYATVLSRLDGVNLSGYQTSVFTDVDINTWYGQAIAWAADNSIISGYGSGVFGPNNLITREQMAVMLSNYMRYKGIVLEKKDYTPFSDDDEVSSWAKEAVVDMQRYGLISGVGNNKYAPQETASRASVAQIFMNFIEAYVK